MMQTKEKSYLNLLWVMFLLFKHYQGYFGYVVPFENAAKISPTVVHADDVPVFRFSFPRIKDFDSPYKAWEIREILNEYLAVTLLPDSDFPPYQHGEKRVQSIYVCGCFYDRMSLNVDIMVVDDLISFNYVNELTKPTI